jgi:hypothetical protein
MPEPATTQREVVTRKPGYKRRSTCIHNNSIVPRPTDCSIQSPPTRPGSVRAGFGRPGSACPGFRRHWPPQLTARSASSGTLACSARPPLLLPVT